MCVDINSKRVSCYNMHCMYNACVVIVLRILLHNERSHDEYNDTRRYNPLCRPILDIVQL